MKTTYLINKYNTKQLSKVIDCITEAIHPEKIFLLGATADHTLSENIFRGNRQPALTVKEYQLLILINADDRQVIDELQNMVESACRSHTAITAMIIHLPVFNKWLQKGHLLAHTVYANNCLIYDAGKVPLAEPGMCNQQVLQDKISRECMVWLNRATECMAGVEMYSKRKQYGMATFLLHQATELAFMTAIRLKTGFKASTHNLNILMRYAVPFCGDELQVFNLNNDKDRSLFKLLQKAYIQGRYENGFVVKEQDFAELLKRVQRLLKVFQDLDGGVIE
ncbi:HEPN domain-containing protein [Paraflavitalea speifideaquila]|uniref:HEPN domain-containing protein n=1 Tax=Paraflavitalea speifideaquila TaxID=3076558 RepID=UPI0028EBACC5|nr:HEPN domain-containing protein [Paraflavitalea speifideiaquila]